MKTSKENSNIPDRFFLEIPDDIDIEQEQHTAPSSKPAANSPSSKPAANSPPSKPAAKSTLSPSSKPAAKSAASPSSKPAAKSAVKLSLHPVQIKNIRLPQRYLLRERSTSSQTSIETKSVESSQDSTQSIDGNWLIILLNRLIHYILTFIH